MTTSKVVAALLEREGLTPLLAARELGQEPPTGAAELLGNCDILALGAAANVVRRRECGDEARVYVPVPPPASAGVVVLTSSETARGTALLRRIAELRLLGPIGLRIVIDAGSLGLEIAQVALSFGASDLATPTASRRGLPMALEAYAKTLVKRREIAAYVERAGYAPVFVSEGHASTREDPVDSPSRANVDS
ncbi:MAG TPA: hypothetical protein VJT73_09820 [Polyangiaceae bacterium]|nr:hypothetical protein [Polyangiaceae bacterium]